MDRKKYLAELENVPPGFVAILPATHPRKPDTHGMLVRNRNTGVYVLISGGAVISVPHKWAQDVAAESGKCSDAIQDLCIARMEELGLNPGAISDMLDGKISRSHVSDYLTRRASIGSHKLQHVLKILKLKIVEE